MIDPGEVYRGMRVYVPKFNGDSRPDWAVAEMDKLSGAEYTIDRFWRAYYADYEWFCSFDPDEMRNVWVWKLDFLEPVEVIRDIEPATEYDLFSFLGL